MLGIGQKWGIKWGADDHDLGKSFTVEILEVKKNKVDIKFFGGYISRDVPNEWFTKQVHKKQKIARISKPTWGYAKDDNELNIGVNFDPVNILDQGKKRAREQYNKYD